MKYEINNIKQILNYSWIAIHLLLILWLKELILENLLISSIL